MSVFTDESVLSSFALRDMAENGRAHVAITGRMDDNRVVCMVRRVDEDRATRRNIWETEDMLIDGGGNLQLPGIEAMLMKVGVVGTVMLNG
jgi:hypothetical protein